MPLEQWNRQQQQFRDLGERAYLRLVRRLAALPMPAE